MDLNAIGKLGFKRLTTIFSLNLSGMLLILCGLAIFNGALDILNFSFDNLRFALEEQKDFGSLAVIGVILSLFLVFVSMFIISNPSVQSLFNRAYELYCKKEA